MLTSSQHRCAALQPLAAGGAPVVRGAAARRSVAARATKLYTNPGSRGKIAEWYIAELGTPVELVQVDMRAGQHKTPAYLKMHPFGQVPVLDDDGHTIFESGAILIYLAAKHAQLDPAAMGKAAQWTLFANSTLSDAFFGAAKSKRDSLLDTLDAILAKQPYLEGESFTVGDVAVGAYLLYLPLFFPDMFPIKQQHVWAYMQRLAARDACPAPYKDGVAAVLERTGGGGGGGMGGLFSKITGR
ncbi:MAG: thioredoxin-like protein [Monoraphidium minutum]|nr:MAG: thioredoxin-like protein [Monoraphidium minutum]